MTIKCRHCNVINQTDRYFCYSCEDMLFSAQETISRLVKAQEELTKRHKEELLMLKFQLKQVEDYLIQGKEEVSSELDLKKHNEEPSLENVQEDVITQEGDPIKSSIEDRIEIVQEEVLPKEENTFKAPVIEPILEKPEPVVLKEIPSEKSFIEKKNIEEAKLIVLSQKVEEQPEVKREIRFKADALKRAKEKEVVEKQVSTFLNPFFEGLELVGKTYRKYKQEGKLPILFMTIAGILAILVGMGYIMQISFEKMGVYSGLVKVGLGFVFSGIVGFIGQRLYKKDKKYEEYSSALLSLMVVLNYLLIYFLTNLSSFPVLSSAQFGFLLIVANTGLSIYLAFKYETKIIAVLSLVGGALTPFYLNESGNPDFYFGYLWILLLAANFIAIHIKWYRLNYISFVLFLILVEGAVFTDASQSTLFVIYIHLFAYLFFYIVLFDKSKLKLNLTKNDLLILCGNLTVLLFNLFDTISNLYLLGTVYGLNGLVFIVILVKGWATLPKPMKVGLFITIGAFIGLTIPCLFGQELMGLFWAIEALLLVILGFVYAIDSVRVEGYVVLAVAMVKLVVSSLAIVELWGVQLFHEGFLNYIVFGVVCSALWYIGNRFKSQLTEFEKGIYNLFKEIIPLWLTSILLIIGFDLMGYYVFNLMILPMYGLIVWHYKFKTTTTEFFAFLQMLFFVLGYALSAEAVQSFTFSEQLIYGKIAILELIFSFWFLKYFYERMGFVKPNEHQLANMLRVLFYVLLPLVIIKQTYKHAYTYLPLSMWVSFFASYGLYKRFKHYALLAESHILIFTAIGVNIAMYHTGWFIGGLITLVTLFILEKGHIKNDLEGSKYFTFLVLSPYIFIGMLGYFMFREGVSSEFIAFVVTALLFVFAFYFNKNTIIYKTYRFAILVGLLLSLINGGYYMIDHPEGYHFIFALILVVGSGFVLVRSKSDYLEHQMKANWGINMVLHQILIVVTYCLLILVLNLDLDGPALTIFFVLHAIALLFLALRTQSKAMSKDSLILFIIALVKVVFHDIRDFSGTNKVIVLIGLGILLLAASYGYVRIKNKYLPQESKINENEE